jgi:uncharacterized repeat protein (TIGR01451 family)
VASTYACFTTTFSPSAPDANASNNSLTECIRIVNSWDPNGKEVSPKDTFYTGDWLTYGIHFQNTGSDTAYTVIIKDTLDANIDAVSFQYLASSHHAVIQLDGSAMTFTFPQDKPRRQRDRSPLSEGWIQYRVKAKPNLSGGTQTQITASIYFDRNPAVVTNTTTNTLVTACSDTTVLLTHAICHGDTFVFYTRHLTSAGTYYDTIHKVTGCDSIVSLTLTVNPLPVVTWQQDSFVGAWCYCIGWSNRPLFGGIPAGGTFSGVYVSGDSIIRPFSPCTHEFYDTSFLITYTYSDTNNCQSSSSEIFRLGIGCEGINESRVQFYPPLSRS